MTQVVFERTALMGTNKEGRLTPDEDGYYTLVLGGLGTFNSAGAYYDLEVSKRMFEASSTFMRRIKDGCVYAELDHPEKTPMQTMRDYMMRLMKIPQDRICAHISKIWLDDTLIRDDTGKPFCAIVGKVKPTGVFGQSLADALANNHQNVCFSIRSFTEDTQEGSLLVKRIREVITFDCVLEPGIAKARKWYAPALEMLASPIVVTKEMLDALIVDRHSSGLGFEDSTTASIVTLRNTVDWNSNINSNVNSLPPSLNWKN